MSILSWIVVGLAAGLLSGLAVEGYGLLEDSIVGVVGSIVGGWVYVTIAGADVTAFSPAGALAATLGSLLFLALSRGLTRDRATI